MWSGWTVHVSSGAADTLLTQVYYANVSGRLDAVEAVRKHIDATNAQILEARKPIQSTVFDAMGIVGGAVVRST
jgi:hypothetical protein